MPVCRIAGLKCGWLLAQVVGLLVEFYLGGSILQGIQVLTFDACLLPPIMNL